MDDIKTFTQFIYSQYKNFKREVPSQFKAHKFIDDLISFLFPIKKDKEECILPQIELNLLQLEIDFMEMLKPMKSRLDNKIEELKDLFFSKLPIVYKNLINDVNSFQNFDPAAKSVEGIILYYPGFYSIAVYRISHEMCKIGIPFVPRMISEYAHSKTGIDIHPGATIGDTFFIDHGTGVVIGETAVIGNNVKIYQGVTLGALFVKKQLANKKRHPTIEDNVVIYSGSTILGGDTVVGHDTVIGGNVWLTKSVPPYSLVYHESKTIIRDKSYQHPMEFII